MFTTYIYQPFFNILVGIYWALGHISPNLEDMGIAVIVFSLVIRIILFPLTLASERSEEEKRKITEKIVELKTLYAHDPVREKMEVQKIMRANGRIVFATTFDLVIQLVIILMLYRIFTTGFEGHDFYLLYSWMPQVNHINLMFLGKYDLSRTNPTLNFLQSVMIFVVEFLVALRSPIPVTRKNVILLQVVLPIGSYLAFLFLPAGKKVFIITSLAFSAIYHAVKLAQETVNKILTRIQPKAPPAPPAVTPQATAADSTPAPTPLDSGTPLNVLK